MEENAESKKVFKIEKVDLVEPSVKTEMTKFIETEEIAPSKTKFDVAFARSEEVAKPTPQEKVTPVTSTENTLLSPIHEMSSRANRVERLEPATQEKILEKAVAIQDKISASTQEIKSNLQRYPDIKIAPTAEAALSEKLIHVDSTLRSSLNLVGAEATTMAPSTTPGNSPLVKFLSYLTHSDKQMKLLMKETQAIGENPQITPGKLLSIQIKLNFVQQEIDFFSSALNKALESTKTIMNVQI